MATTYYIALASSGGSDSNNGLSTGAPFLTFSHAFTTMAGGDTLYALDGNYTITTTTSLTRSGTDEAHRTRILSLNRWGAKLTNNITAAGAAADAIFQVYADYVDIEGFEISGANGGMGIYTAGSVAGSTGSGDPLGSHNRIRYNYIHDLGSAVSSSINVTGIDFARYGHAVYNAVYNEASGNIIRNVGSPHESGCHGIYFGTAYGTITNNIVSGTPGYGINCFHFPHHMKIKNNLVFNCGDNSADPNGGNGGGIYLSAGGTDYVQGTDEPCDFCEVDNNIIVGSVGVIGAGIIEYAQGASPPELVVANNVFRNNCFYNNTGQNGDIIIQSSTSSISGSVKAPQTSTPRSTDTFVRANQSGWGTASGGGTWTNSGDTTHLVLSILSNQGKATGSSVNNFMVLGSSYSGDTEVLVRVKTSSAASGNFQGVLLRYSDTTHWYACYLKNGTTLKIDSAAFSLASTSFTWSANTEYWLRFNITGSALSGRAWADGASEPTTWNITTSDNTLTSGKAGIYSSPDSSATTALYDSFSNALLTTDPNFPYFVNYQLDGSGDYHLQSISPCIDTGISTGAPSTDFDGVARPQVIRYDIGPYEYVTTALTYYGSSVLDGVLTTASKMAPTSGGVETSKTTIFTVTGHVYGEIRSQGNAGLATVDAIPATPTGHGWIFYPGAGTFGAGGWSAIATLSAAAWGGNSARTTATIRFFKYTPGTGYTPIGTITKAITGIAKTTYTFAATSAASVTMGASDGIYVDLWWWDNNSYAATDNPTIYESSSATQGVTNDLVVTTSVFTLAHVIRNASGRASLIAPRTTKNASGRVSIQSVSVVTPTVLIQSRTGSVGPSNATYVTVTSAPTTQHNLLVAFVEIQGVNGVIVTPPTDWQLVSGSTTDMGSYGTATIGLYYLPDCPDVVTSHTFSFDSSVNACVAFEEWSGLSRTSPLDRYVIQHNAKTTAAPTGTTSALASGNELAVWGLAVHAAGVLTYSAVTNGYVEDTGAHAYSAETSRAQGTLFYNKSVGPSATSSRATMSAAGGSGNTTILAVFKQTASTASKGAAARVRVVSSTQKSAAARVRFGGNLAGKNAVGRVSVVVPPQSTRSAAARVRFNANPTTVKSALGRLTFTVSRTTKNASGRARLAVAHTYYVATTGNDTTGNGSAGSPWATLEKARTLVVAGDTVRVLSGLYTPSYSTTRGVYTSVSGIISSPITWVSDVKYGARIVTTGKTDSWYNAGNYTIIDGFDISSTDATTGLNNASNYSSVRNCLVHDNPGYGIYHGVGFTYAETISNVVARCGEAATHHGIYHGVATGYIQNNIVAQAGGYNIYLWNAATTVTVANNLSIDAGVGGILIGAGDTGATVCDFCIISNNAVLYNISGGGYGIREFGATGIHNQYLNNCVYGNTIDIALSNGLTALATLATDPLFMDYQADGSGDYHLKQPSPLRAAGTATGMPVYDIAGYVRTIPPDIGPYSYDASGFPPLAAMVGSAILPVLQDGFTFDQRIDDRAGGSFSVVDSTLSYVFDENQAITIADIKEDVTLYNGFIDKADEILLVPPNTLRRTFTLKDLRYLLEKRLCIEDFVDWIAGAIVAHTHQSVLQEEGILASYALDRDHDAVAFGEGTLTNVSAANGYLELARAGTNVVDADTTTADFAAGTLSGVVATDNTLTLASYTALKVSGTAGKNVGVNAGNYYTYWTIWSGSLTINSGDYLEYSMWISSMSADLVGGVDILCSDKTALKDTHWPDQYGIDSHPGAHLQGWADDQWLYRKIVMPPAMVGKTMNTVRVALESDKDGFYAFYARGIHLKSSGGTTRAAIFDTTLQRCTKVSNIGYYHIVIKPLTVYEERGTRIAPSLTLTSVGIAGGSDCSWTATETAQPASVFSETDTPLPQVLVESSIDGGDTWQTCTNNHVIPSLIVGENLSGKSLLLKQTLAVGGPNPEMAPVISDCAVGIESAYNMTKTDASRSYAGSEMTDGTNTNCGYQAAINTADGWQRNDVSGLKMNGWRKTWRTGESPNQPVFGPSVPGAGTSNGAYYIQSGAGTGAHVQLQNAGTYTPTIVMEADIQIGTANNAGILYFTTFWGNTDNSFGYYAYISTDVIGFGKGANANSNTWTSLWTLSATLDTNQWYHIKTVCGSDHIHHIFIDDVEYITWTDASYTSGGIGMRMSSGGANGQAHFDNIGVATIGVNTDYTPATATRTAPSVSLSTVANVGDSRIWWVEDIPSGCTLDVQVSINGGGTYVSCVNGETLPVLSHGQSLSGVSLLLKVIQTSGSISYTPTLLGVSWVVTGVFSASGNRISPLLSTIPAGVIGSSSVTWDADEPSSTTFEVDGSLDGSAWTLMNNGDAFVGLVQQGDVWWDSFDVDTSTDYTVS